jgi:hypothetical protein
MHRIELMPPVIEGQSAQFAWRVEPETALWRKTRFTLTFPVPPQPAGTAARSTPG